VRGLMARYRRKAELFPNQYARNGFEPIRTVREFDDRITAPYFGYKDAEEYYRSAGAKNVIGKVRVPLLLLSAQDDPFVPYETLRQVCRDRVRWALWICVEMERGRTVLGGRKNCGVC
jgi:predicted alpha/beta-fold hydrolase